MTSPYGPPGGSDPQQPWGQQPYGGGPAPGTPSGGFPAQGYGQPGQHPYGQPDSQQPYGGYGQHPYGGYGQQPGGFPGAPPQPKKSNTWIWVLTAVLVLAVAAFLVLGFLVFGFLVPKKVLDEGALESDNGVKKVLTAKPPNGYDIPADKIESVDCPANKDVKVGNEFDCTVKIDGQDRTVHIKVRDDEGQYEVSAPDGG
jgi:Domain of unknown function (DUF4333)